ncbi:superoxide dismutase (Mn) [Hyphomicrobium sp. 1Nfss2.1]|uniref:superoxide dismutase n=1 Tax=Hyphomicrobium sp. 1Nfss2.1 TaxID=3413936 RepID=UPI003C7B4FCB
MLNIQRRTLLTGAAAAAVSVTIRPVRGWAADESGPFKLPPLLYDFSALEPSIDAKTMELHHDKHHAAYVKNLNAAVKDHPKVAAMKLEEILVKLPEMPESIRTTVRNNAGGHANHSMFWQIMGHDGGAPEGELKAAIEADLGGLDKLKEDFNAKGAKVFGSGWVFVTVTPEGKLALVSKPNQDTPLMEGERVLFGNDVWEHAYYLKYQNRRPEYLKAWWDVVNWKAIGDRFAAAKAGTLTI